MKKIIRQSQNFLRTYLNFCTRAKLMWKLRKIFRKFHRQVKVWISKPNIGNLYMWSYCHDFVWQSCISKRKMKSIKLEENTFFRHKLLLIWAKLLLKYQRCINIQHTLLPNMQYSVQANFRDEPGRRKFFT